MALFFLGEYHMKLTKLLLTAVLFSIFTSNGLAEITPPPETTIEESWYYHINDHLGSCRTVFKDTNGTALVVQEFDYYPFGMEMPGQTDVGGTKAIFTYSNKELDDEAGVNLHYFGARFYNAEIGRWLSVDPLGELRAHESPYSYCGNNPLSRIDPTGLYWGITEINGENALIWVVEKPVVVFADRYFSPLKIAGFIGLGVFAFAEPSFAGEALFYSTAIASGWKVGSYLSKQKERELNEGNTETDQWEDDEGRAPDPNKVYVDKDGKEYKFKPKRNWDGKPDRKGNFVDKQGRAWSKVTDHKGSHRNPHRDIQLSNGRDYVRVWPKK